jgi:hypothetical protein
MTRIYKGVEGYDIEHEYAALAAEIQREKELADANSAVVWRDLFFVKTNAVSAIQYISRSESNS